ncbi:MAG: DM13 domain-containing protein [Myxococcota bacterium]|nr:DM13 domain-containing protein [Myxococcota bacterium]
MRNLLALLFVFLTTGALLPSASAAECDSTHAKVGWQAVLESHHHGTSGTVTVVDDCTLRIDNFNYDGKGVDVRFVVADNSRFKKNTALTKDLHGKGTYEGKTLTVKLPAGMSLDQVDYLSFWCVAFKVSFADGKLAAAPEKMLGKHSKSDAMDKQPMNQEMGRN